MNGEQLYEAVGRISPIYVHEAQIARFPRPAWRTFAVVAACVAVVILIYTGIPSLLYDSFGTAAPELAAPTQQPSVVGSPPSVAETAAAYLRTSLWFNLGSLLLGLAAWVMPMFSLLRRQGKQKLTLASFACCALALLLQVCNVLHKINTGRFVVLADTMWFVLLAAVVLVAGTGLLNLAVYMKRLFEQT